MFNRRDIRDFGAIKCGRLSIRIIAEDIKMRLIPLDQLDIQ